VIMGHPGRNIDTVWESLSQGGWDQQPVLSFKGAFC
jgi:hypothetical protein